MQNKIRVAVLTGGEAAELEVSLASAAVVAKNLNKDTYEVFTVNISSSPWLVKGENVESTIDLNDFSFSANGVKHRFDVVFMAIHGTPAEDGKLQGYFDLMKIPYTCCGTLASAITFDKDVCKQMIMTVDVNMAKDVLLNTRKKQAELVTDKMTFPVFVKPNKNGSSYGVSKVKKADELIAAIENAFKYDDEVLVEEFIEGRELGCGVIEKGGELICFPITEIISENEFFDYEAKYKGKSKEITPANLTEQQAAKCHELAKIIYRQLKLKGAVRIDFFLKDNDFYFLEVNTIPGLSNESIIPQQARAYGWSLEQFFDILITETLDNFQQ